MIDPLSEIITLLRPRTVSSKLISGAGKWGIYYSAFEQPSFCTILKGSCLLTIQGKEPVILNEGDFVFMPVTPSFTISGFGSVVSEQVDAKNTSHVTEEVRHGDQDGQPDVLMLGGYFSFDSVDTALFVSLLPQLLHVQSAEKLSVLVQLIRDEFTEQRSGREHILMRLVEILLIESLRLMEKVDAPVGLLRGLAEPRLAEALRHIHGNPSHSWTMDELARKVALSRSTFFERFTNAIGIPPMEYLLAWRMTIAKDLLSQQNLTITQIAEQVGYGSASAFSTAFSRYVGLAPSKFTYS
ncbi:hypothetical protein F908_02215 [Acinetobacter sp. NIPH 284]|uniref:AraC family transcriptional regulator n=1 Tax=Acinetobacter sp. NIPH 284 TaxID=1217704 RepID=UPI0002CE5338|nr:AraC family transcriptional regulator [Acinetobacter sp. NIPH 284]ENW80018.1 hypothetical protein F908_02215 [Acinetobacter sp. NIPH 284]